MKQSAHTQTPRTRAPLEAIAERRPAETIHPAVILLTAIPRIILVQITPADVIGIKKPIGFSDYIKDRQNGKNNQADKQIQFLHHL